MPLTAFSINLSGNFARRSVALIDLCPPGYPVCLIYSFDSHLFPDNYTFSALITTTLSPQSTCGVKLT